MYVTADTDRLCTHTPTTQSTNQRADGRLALLTNSRVDVFAYPGEELEPYYRWTVPLHEERSWAQCCGTLAAQVRRRKEEARVCSYGRNVVGMKGWGEGGR